MYNALCGKNSISEVLLNMLGYSESDFGRFRDCYLSPDGSSIIVYTRCGGGNRESYQHVFDKMSQSEYYLKDYDDGFDETFASIEFRVPEQYKEQCKTLSESTDTRTGQQRFQDFMKMLDEDFEGTLANNVAARNLTDNLVWAIGTLGGEAVREKYGNGNTKR